MCHDRLEIMTSDTAKPQPRQEAKRETFRSHLPAIIAATAGTVLAAILGSLIGTAGTIAGMVIGSIASGTCSWWAERGIRRSAAVAAARAEAIRTRGRQLHPHEDAAIAQAAADAQAAAGNQDTATGGRHSRPRRYRRLTGLAAVIAAAFAGGALAVTVVEGAAGKPLSAVVQGRPGHGTTFGGGAVGKAAPASPSPSPSASATGLSATPSASSPAPTGASTSPSASPSPAATASSSTSPASTPSPVVPPVTPTG